jgi:signal transduction histidine kinase
MFGSITHKRQLFLSYLNTVAVLTFVSFAITGVLQQLTLQGLVRSQNALTATQEWRSASNGIHAGWVQVPPLANLCVTLKAAPVFSDGECPAPGALALAAGRSLHVEVDGIGVTAVFAYSRWPLSLAIGALAAAILVLLQALLLRTLAREDGSRPYLSRFQRLLRQQADELVELKQQAALSAMAAQVAHDVRSPLAALSVAERGLEELPESKRLMIRSAVHRIQDIANDLLRKHNQQREAAAGAPAGVELIAPLIEGVVMEKRLQHSGRYGLEIQFDLGPASYACFARVQASELKRVLSNLLDNAVEAIEREGKIRVSLRQEGQAVLIAIEDSGRGIAPEIQSRLFVAGATFGKAAGSGLGLAHARATLEGWGGVISLDSAPGQGTRLRIGLAASPPPPWFAPSLEVRADGDVVIVDDDPSVHQVWIQHFRARLPGFAGRLHHFSEEASFLAWFRAHPEAAAQALYLIDYEFKGSSRNGLDIVHDRALQGRAVLVTSRYDQADVRAGCLRERIRMVPKNLASFVPLTRARAGDAVEPGADGPFAYSLIDDDALVRLTWKTTAERAGIRLAVFASLAEFRSRIASPAQAGIVYIDSELGDGVKGEEEAERLHAEGYVELYLATGHAPARFSHLKFLRGVAGKSPPWE